jgi:meiotically up-regulated gene 157 (Mug157) protein
MALKRILTTLDEQAKDDKYEKTNNITFYTFYRDVRELASGQIKPSASTGMIRTGFRPSDDPN